MYGSSRLSCSCLINLTTLGCSFELRYRMPEVGSKQAPLQVAPPWNPGTTTVPLRLGGVKAAPAQYVQNRRNTSSCAWDERSVRSDSPTNWRAKGGGLTGNG